MRSCAAWKQLPAACRVARRLHEPARDRAWPISAQTVLSEPGCLNPRRPRPRPGRRSKEPHPARDRRRSPRSQALADAAPPLPALVGSAAPGRDRAHLRARLHRAVARDPDPDPANDRQRDRRRRPIAPRPLPGADHRNRDRPLRDQLHPPLRDRARRDRRRGAAARDDVRRLPPVSARLLRPARDR